MTNWTLINEVVKYITNLYEAEGITETTKSIEARTLNWYNNTDFAEFETLAAAVYLSDFSKNIDYELIMATRETLFFDIDIPLELTNFHIGEIEESLNDIFLY